MTEVIQRFFSMLWRALRHFSEDHGPNHAAAVAYFSLLSLPPFLLLSGRFIARLLPETVGTNAMLAALAPFLPSEIATSLDSVEKSVRGDALVAVAVPVLLWVASHAFSSLEIAINVAFGTTPQRRFWLSRLKAFAGLSGGVMLLGGTVVASHIASWLDYYYARTGAPPSLSPRAHFVSMVALLGVSFAVFTLFYKLLPRGKVAWSSSAKAAVVAVVLWEGARRVFGGLLARSPTFGFFTGSLAGIVAFLAWVYVAVAVTIYGAEVAALMNGNRPAPAARVHARR